MKNIIEYLDDLKEKTGSDYKSAKELKIDKSSLSMIRKRGQMADETAIKIADLLGVKRSEVLIAATIARSDGEVKQEWLNFSRSCGYSVVVMLSGGMGLNAILNAIDSVKLHIMLNLMYQRRNA